MKRILGQITVFVFVTFAVYILSILLMQELREQYLSWHYRTYVWDK